MKCKICTKLTVKTPERRHIYKRIHTLDFSENFLWMFAVNQNLIWDPHCVKSIRMRENADQNNSTFSVTHIFPYKGRIFDSDYWFDIVEWVYATIRVNISSNSKVNWSSRPEVFFQKAVLKNFAKFTGKLLSWSLSFNKGLRPATFWKKEPQQMSSTVFLLQVYFI